MKILLVLPAADAYRVRPGERPPRRAPLRFSVLPLTAGAAATRRPTHRARRASRRALPVLGPVGAALGLRLGPTDRYDNRREGIAGRNPARDAPARAAAERVADAVG